MGDDYRVPRSFALLEELDNVKKGRTPIWTVGMAIKDPKDIELKEFVLNIQGPMDSPNFEGRSYEVQVLPGPNYPQTAPSVQFLRPKINLKCVDSKGRVSKFPWGRGNTICDIGAYLFSEMKKVAHKSQPAASTSY